MFYRFLVKKILEISPLFLNSPRHFTWKFLNDSCRNYSMDFFRSSPQDSSQYSSRNSTNIFSKHSFWYFLTDFRSSQKYFRYSSRNQSIPHWIFHDVSPKTNPLKYLPELEQELLLRNHFVFAQNPQKDSPRNFLPFLYKESFRNSPTDFLQKSFHGCFPKLF